MKKKVLFTTTTQLFEYVALRYKKHQNLTCNLLTNHKVYLHACPKQFNIAFLCDFKFDIWREAPLYIPQEHCSLK